MAATQLQAQQYKYYVQFSDKDGTPYSLSEPTAFLSQRSIDRRLDKGIALDSLDLPVNPSYGKISRDVSALTPGLYIIRTRTVDGTTCTATFSKTTR